MGSYSYRQPPRCSHCWQRGHTKNHCPDIAQAAKDGQDWAIRYINAQKQSTKNRKCSYCKEQGHNKRGCHKLKEDKAFYDKIVKEFITTSLEEMNKSNLGAGSLISYKPTSTLVNCETATVAYITEIVTKNRKPTWQWLAKRFRGKGQEEEAFDRFVGYSDLNSHPDIVFKIQSVTGTGLGYWGDVDTCWVEYENFKREAEKGSESRIKLLG